MNPETKKLVCGNCEHYMQYPGMTNGLCYFNPPTVFAGGDKKRPTVTKGEKACGFHQMLPEGQEPASKEKQNADRHRR